MLCGRLRHTGQKRRNGRICPSDYGTSRPLFPSIDGSLSTASRRDTGLRARPAGCRAGQFGGVGTRRGDELAPISVPAPGIFGFTAAWRYGCRRQIELGCVRGTIAPSASTSPATPLVDDSRGVPRADIGIEGRAQIPLRRGRLDKAEGGQRLLRRLFGFCFITHCFYA